MLNTPDAASMIKSIAVVIREHVSKAFGALSTRISAIEESIRNLPVPKDGQSVTVEDVAPLISVVVAESFKRIRLPEDGKSVTIDELVPVVDETVARAVAAIPVPKDGTSVTIDDVLPIIDAAVKAIPIPKDGTSVTPDQVIPALSAQLDLAIQALPVPKDGRDGTDGKSVSLDEVLPTVKQWFDAVPRPSDGKNGVDGKSITIADVSEFMESSMAKWALEFERRASDLIQRCIDRIEKPKDGLPGKDGRDALELENFDLIKSEDGRTITVALIRGAERIEKSVVIDSPIYRGIYKNGEKYQRGDWVTFGGSVFTATRATDSKPETDDSWKLCLKRGRDGKQGDPGRDFRPTTPVKVGASVVEAVR